MGEFNQFQTIGQIEQAYVISHYLFRTHRNMSCDQIANALEQAPTLVRYRIRKACGLSVVADCVWDRVIRGLRFARTLMPPRAGPAPRGARRGRHERASEA